MRKGSQMVSRADIISSLWITRPSPPDSKNTEFSKMVIALNVFNATLSRFDCTEFLPQPAQALEKKLSPQYYLNDNFVTNGSIEIPTLSKELLEFLDKQLAVASWSKGYKFPEVNQVRDQVRAALEAYRNFIAASLQSTQTQAQTQTTFASR